MIDEVMAIDQEATKLEKNGDIENAVARYEDALLCSYKIFHPFERLLVYYRRIKDYDNEMRVALAALDKWPEDEKLTKRLNKIVELMQESNGKS